MGEKMADETHSSNSAGFRQRTHDSVDRIMDKAESIRDSGKESMARVKEKAVMMKQNVDSYIRKNPEKSVLIAAGVGAVVGAVSAAAMMRRKHKIRL